MPDPGTVSAGKASLARMQQSSVWTLFTVLTFDTPAVTVTVNTAITVMQTVKTNVGAGVGAGGGAWP